ncbi:MAG: hypothetical protein EOO15_17540 [Chitinophagaceae bacterium]|nr:MAG: hypothetical protein EOO15_17540 [Chitinophagaceae bacterium]
MFLQRTLLSCLLLTFLLSACFSGDRRVFIVTNCSVALPKSADTTFEVTLSKPGIYTMKHEVVVDGKSLSIVQDGKRAHFTIDENGQYLLNLAEDTLLSNPAVYSRQMFGGTDIVANIGARRNPGLPSGNPKADSIISRLDRARAAAEKRKEEELLRKGHSTVQTILPGTIARISRNESARLFILADAPKQVEAEQGADIEYYEINTFRYWLSRIQTELEKQMEGDRRQYY